MSTVTKSESLNIHAMNTDIFKIQEANQNSLLTFDETNGFYLTPSENVPNRGDVTNYVLTSENEFGKFQWQDPLYIPNISAKESVRVASTTDIDITNTVSVIDGVNLNIGDRVLLKDQVNLSENGLYEVDSSGLLIRTYDATVNTPSTGAFVYVTEGVANAVTNWLSPTYDSFFGDPISFVIVSGSGGGGTPSLPFSSIQYNNAGSFGGIVNISTNGTDQFNLLDNTTINIGSSNETSISFDSINTNIVQSSGNLNINLDNTSSNLILSDASDNIIINISESGFINQNVVSDLNLISSLVDGTNLNEIYSFDVQGDFLFFSGSTTGQLGAINISQPSSPSFINSITPGAGFTGSEFLKVRAKYCYVTTDSNGFYIFDVSDPSSISSVGNIVDGTNLLETRGFDFSGDHAFVGCTNRLTSIDISDPSAPVVNQSLLSAFFFNGIVINVFVYSKYAFCISPERFVIVNISDPGSMSVVGSISSVNLSDPYGIFVRGSYAFISRSTLVVIDISDIATPSIVANFSDASFSEIKEISLSGDYLYATDDGTGNIVTFDISVPTSPSIVAITSNPGVNIGRFALKIQGTELYRVSRDDNTLFIYQLNGITIPSVQSGNLQVKGDTTITNNVNVQGYLNVRSGAQFNNALAVLSNMTVHDDFYSRGRLITKNIINNDNTNFYYHKHNNSINEIDTVSFSGKITIEILENLVFKINNPNMLENSNCFLNVIGQGSVKLLSIQNNYFIIEAFPHHSNKITFNYLIIT